MRLYLRKNMIEQKKERMESVNEDNSNITELQIIGSGLVVFTNDIYDDYESVNLIIHGDL